jgi:hypothetical protein
MQKEINSLLRMNVFQLHQSSYHNPKNQGWQYEPLRMIFAATIGHKNLNTQLLVVMDWQDCKESHNSTVH